MCSSDLLKHLLWKDQSIGGYDSEINFLLSQEIGLAFERDRLSDRKAKFERAFLGWAGTELSASPCGSIRLGVDRDDLGPSFGQGVQRGHGELRCAGEYHACAHEI